MKRFNLVLSAFFVFVFFNILSCGFGRMGTGVVVWTSDNKNFSNGTIVWVWEQSRIRKTFKIENEKGGPTQEMDTWRIKFFPDDGQARKFATQFAPWKNTWGISGKQGLPVRAEANSNSDRVYKLGDQEEVKVLFQQKEKVQQGDLNGSWVEILTKDGFTGWIFDYYLALVEKNGNKLVQVKQNGPGDTTLQTIQGNLWYPEEFQAMIDQGRINLDIFKDSYGLRFQGKNTLLLALPSQAPQEEPLNYTFQLKEPQTMNDLTYLFPGTVPVTIRMFDSQGQKAQISFTLQGQLRSWNMVRLAQPLGTYVSQEMAARQQKMDDILAQGAHLTSPVYGDLQLTASGNFTWTNFNTLMASGRHLLPAGFQGNGKLVFDWFKDPSFVGDWKTLRMEFNVANGPSESRVFLYRMINNGIQFLPLEDPQLDQQKKTVLHEGQSSLSLFFNQMR